MPGPAKNVGVGVADRGLLEDVFETLDFHGSICETERAVEFVASDRDRFLG